MGCIRRNIHVEGKPRWTAFDSGTRASYIRRSATGNATTIPTGRRRRAILQERVHVVDTVCLVRGSIDGHQLELLVNVVDDLGPDGEGRPIEVLFGAIAMQNWGVKLDLENERLDIDHFADIFVEFHGACGSCATG